MFRSWARSVAIAASYGIGAARIGASWRNASVKRPDCSAKEDAMHNIGSTQAEGWELGPMETSQFEFAGEGETFGETGGELMSEAFDAGLRGEGMHSHTFGEQEFGEAMELPLSEAEEMELASELLEVSSEAELDHFLGGLFKRVWRGVRKFAPQLGGILKGVARTALPMLGTAVGGPLGGTVASAAGRIFGLELEGLSGEDQEFEAARRFVRFACAAAKKAGQAPASADPTAVARAASTAAARAFAPGLLRNRAGAHSGAGMEPIPSGSRRRGMWIRRGRRIVLLGI
jgi:hypothetical protein